MRFLQSIMGLGLLLSAGGTAAAELNSTAPAGRALEIRGIAYLPASDGHGSNLLQPESTESIKRLAATGANAIEIVQMEGQDTRYATEIHPIPQTEPDEAIVKAIRDAKANGLSVMLKLHDDSLDGGSDRQHFRPVSPALWFESYKRYVLHHAALAETNGVDIFCIGAEFASLSGPAYRMEWLDIIDAVRRVFHGKVTYAAITDEASRVAFWDKLDYIGVDAYFPLTDHRDPTVAEMMQGWIQVTPGLSDAFLGVSPVEYLHALARQYDKPVILPEIGFTSTAGTNIEPGIYGAGAPADDQEQADAWAATLAVWTRNAGDWMKGMYVWQWDPFLDPESKSWIGTSTYTIQNKPAEAVVTQWYHCCRGLAATSPAAP